MKPCTLIFSVQLNVSQDEVCMHRENSIKVNLQNISSTPECDLIFLPNSIPYFDFHIHKIFLSMLQFNINKIMQVLLFCVLTSFSLHYVCEIHPFCCMYRFFVFYCSTHCMNKLICFIYIHLKAYKFFLI